MGVIDLLFMMRLDRDEASSWSYANEELQTELASLKSAYLIKFQEGLEMIIVLRELIEQVNFAPYGLLQAQDSYERTRLVRRSAQNRSSRESI